MLAECFENVAPYIDHLGKIKEFVELNKDKSNDEIIRILERRIEEEKGTLRTDYIILLNEVRRRIKREQMIP